MQIQDEPVLDLGEVGRHPFPPEAGGPHHWRRLAGARVAAPTVAVLVLAAGAMGGLGAYRWQNQQRLHGRQSTVDVMVVGDATLGSGGSSDGHRARFGLDLTVVNAGPLPIDLHDVRADEQGVTLRGTSVPGRLESHTAASVGVVVTVDCATGIPAEPVGLGISVTTADGASRKVSYPLALKKDAEQACWITGLGGSGRWKVSATRVSGG